MALATNLTRILNNRRHPWLLLCVVISFQTLSQPTSPPTTSTKQIGATIHASADGGVRRLSRVVLFGNGSRLAIIVRLQTDAESKDEFACFDVTTGASIAGFATAGEHVEEVSGSLDGSRVALQIVQKNLDRTLRVCDARDGKKIWEYNSRNGIMPCFFSAGGKQILLKTQSTPDAERRMVLVDLASGKVVAHTDLETYDNPMAMSPDLSFVVSVEGNGGIIDLASLKTGHRFHSIRDGQRQPALTAMFRPDNKRLQALYPDGTVMTWEIESGKQLSRVSPQKPIPQPADMVFSRDGERIFMRVQDSIVVLDTNSGKELEVFHHGPQPTSYAELNFTKAGQFAVRIDPWRSGDVAVMELPAKR